MKTPDEVLDKLKKLAITGLSPSNKDDLLLANGLDYHVIVKCGIN